MADRFGRGRGRVVQRATKRVNAWVGSADQGGQSIASNASAILQSNATLGGTTVVRTRGLLLVRPQGFGADLDMQGALGIGIVSDQAFAAGAASIPGPWTDPDWDGWFLWMAWALRVEFSDASGVNIPADVTQQIDSKAMRKVQFNETLVVMAESQAGAVIIETPFRMLVKLA